MQSHVQSGRPWRPTLNTARISRAAIPALLILSLSAVPPLLLGWHALAVETVLAVGVAAWRAGRRLRPQPYPKPLWMVRLRPAVGGILPRGGRTFLLAVFAAGVIVGDCAYPLLTGIHTIR